MISLIKKFLKIKLIFAGKYCCTNGADNKDCCENNGSGEISKKFLRTF
jgi:hypothetical protein